MGYIIQISAWRGWLVEVSQPLDSQGYQCWIVRPDLAVLNDGTIYQSSSAAMSAGRQFVERNR
jgi:exosome complex RNA-binding protein Rrp42 (RNase PH superfamily)